MRTHRKLTSHERDKIAYCYAVGERIREIARRLGRSPSSISDEIRRNKIGGRYHSIRAHQASEARKHNSHKKYALKTRPNVVGKLGLGWSPEQIAGRLRKEINEGVRPPEEYINHESIYRYIYDEPQSELRLWEKLPRRHRKRRRWLGRKSRPVKIPNRVSIRERPERREQPSGLRALGRRYSCWRPAQNRCSYGGRAGLPSALCLSGAPHSGERNLFGPALYLWEPSQTGAPINNIGQWE
jgi:transposase, IS30 family